MAGKGDLVEAVAKKAGISKKAAGEAVNAVVGFVVSALKQGDKVTIPGFGTFSVAERAARTGRNPKTLEEIKIPAKKVPKFKAGKGLKEAVK